MSNYRLDRGLVIQIGNKQYAFQRQIELEIQFEEVETGRILVLPQNALVADVLKGDIKIVTSSIKGNVASLKGDENESLIQTLVNLTEKNRIRHEYRCGYIREFQKLGITKGCRNQIGEQLPVIASKLNDSRPPSVSTVMHWLKKFENAGGSYYALLDKYKSARLPFALNEQIQEKIHYLLDKYYLVLHGESVAQVYSRLMSDTEMYFSDESGKRKIPLISRSTFYRLVQQIPGKVKDKARLGSSAARARWRQSIGGVYATRPLERVEMDHTLLDLYVIDDNLGIPLGRPVITILIDTYSNYILALYVGFDGESLGRVIRTIRMALSPKDDLTKMAQTQNEWLTPGLFECLVVDNALSFQSDQMHKIASALEIDLEYSAVRQPWFKASVERAMASVTKILPRQGRPNKIKNGVVDPVDPAETACIRFSDLVSLLTKWAVDVHSLTINKRTLKRPIDLMTEGLKNAPAPIFSSSLDGLELITCLSKQVTVSHTGIEFQYLSYRSPALRDLVFQQPEPKFKTTIKYDPSDLGSIWVLNPKTKEWINIPCIYQSYAKGLTLFQHKYIRAQNKEKLVRNTAEERYLQARNDLQNSFDEAVIKGKNSIKQAKKMAKFNDKSSLTPTQSIAASKEDISTLTDNPDFLIESSQVLDNSEFLSEAIEIFDTYNLNETFGLKG